VVTMPAGSHRALAVSATYYLSERGRKLSLLAGGDGRALQQLTIEVPINRLHLVSVDSDGVARLKLRPRYELDRDQQVVRIDAPPTFDTPPDLETLFHQAAHNHQLERTYESQRHAARALRRDADQERRTQVAQAFLADSERRALVHPAPSLRRCYVSSDRGRVLFDVTTDQGAARELPAEAHRRFRADLRARAEQTDKERIAQLAVHEEKKRQIAEWIGIHGTAEQQSRQAAGMLPMEEAIEAITDHVFSALRDWPRYFRDGANRLEAHLRRLPEYADAIVTARDVVITSSDAAKASAAQWAQVQGAHTALPEATVTLRVHSLAWAGDRQASSLMLFGILVTQKFGVLTLRREYMATG
jgi:hypothetical protein